METYAYTTRLAVYSCGKCRHDFGVPENVVDHGKKRGGSVWCPSCGFQMTWGRGEVEQLRAQLARQEGATAEARAEAKRAEYSRRAEKAAKTRLKNRIANGVCPCCKRTFRNVADHIKTNHPDFAKEHREALGAQEGEG